MRYFIYMLLCSALVTGCADLRKRASLDRFSKLCSEAQKTGNIKDTAEYCYKAYKDVEWENLKPKLRSERLYNYGRILRKTGRFEDAKVALTKALDDEIYLSGASSIESRRRMAELAATYYEMGEIDDGVKYVDRLISITELHTGNDKEFIARLLYSYASRLRGKQQQKSDEYKTKMREFGYSDKHFNGGR